MQDVPNFDYAPGYTAFQFVFVLIQSSAFGGVFTGFGIARDFQMGFGRRLMLAAPRRSAIVAGYLISGLVRALFTMTVVTVVAPLGLLMSGTNALPAKSHPSRKIRARLSPASRRARPPSSPAAADRRP